MYARLSTYQSGPIPPHVDLAEGSAPALRQVRQLPGFCGAYFLTDRASGREIVLSLWKDEESMWASEAKAAQIRAESAAREQQQIISVEHFEVGFAHLED
ncbi:hypothetical protein ACIGXM_05405 [Kitasatospora sp. NPDC052896]|uniref:hypothetical protein n=1 Tax=Kitasatospora sp. NPDC052896 TaxID=3364061 RepID=UPI0037CAD9C0